MNRMLKKIRHITTEYGCHASTPPYSFTHMFSNRSTLCPSNQALQSCSDITTCRVPLNLPGGSSQRRTRTQSVRWLSTGRVQSSSGTSSFSFSIYHPEFHFPETDHVVIVHPWMDAIATWNDEDGNDTVHCSIAGIVPGRQREEEEEMKEGTRKLITSFDCSPLLIEDVFLSIGTIKYSVPLPGSSILLLNTTTTSMVFHGEWTGSESQLMPEYFSSQLTNNQIKCDTYSGSTSAE